MTALGKHKRMTLTKNHNVVLRVDKGDPDPLLTPYIKLMSADMILYSRIVQINALSFFIIFTFFRANSCQKLSKN